MLRKYVSAGTYYVLGNIINKGIAFFTIPIFTRILTTYDYGIVNTYTSWMSILTMVLGMTLHIGIRAAFNDYLKKINDFMSSITFLSIISSLCMSLIVISSILLVPININIFLVVLCLIHGFFSAIIQNYSMYLMMKVKYKARMMMLVIPNILINCISIFAILYIFKNQAYLGKIIPSVVITILWGLVIIIKIFKKSQVLINKNYWKYAIFISLPIILHGLSLNILSQSDRIMLTSLKNASETGVYSLVYNFSMLANIVFISLDGVWVPWFTNKLNEQKINQINNRAKGYTGIMAFVTIGIILISPELLVIISPKEYWYGKMIIPVIILSSFIMFLYSFYVNIEHYHKKTKRIALNTIVAACSNIILNFIFIPKYGLYAASVTTLISYTISLILHYNYAKKIEKALFPIKIFVLPFLMILVASTIFYVSLNIPLLRWIMFGLTILLFFALDYREIKYLMETLKIN